MRIRNSESKLGRLMLLAVGTLALCHPKPASAQGASWMPSSRRASQISNLSSLDSTGTLPGGLTFQSPSEMKVILKSDPEAFARCLTEKMLTYALGRGLERYDQPAVNLICRRLAADDYRFSRLLLEIVRSMPFEMRHGEAPKSAPQPTMVSGGAAK